MGYGHAQVREIGRGPIRKWRAAKRIELRNAGHVRESGGRSAVYPSRGEGARQKAVSITAICGVGQAYMESQAERLFSILGGSHCEAKSFLDSPSINFV